MKKDKNILKELEELAPRLSKLKKEQADDVPHHYFEALPEKIFDKIRKEEEKIPAWRVWLAQAFQPKLRVAYAIAAAVVLGLFIMNSQNVNPESLEMQFAELSEQDLNNYVLANLEDFDDSWLSTNYVPSESDDVLFLDTDIETIEEYLLEEMSDLEYDGVIL